MDGIQALGSTINCKLFSLTDPWKDVQVFKIIWCVAWAMALAQNRILRYDP